jgi:NAD(P)-dependent dehydrogenase (short-subunit alcohol dehydrogenase family)
MTVLDCFRLDGRVAMVTGGSRGLGRAMSLALCEAGASVAVTARTPLAAERVASELAEATGGHTIGVALEVTRRESVESAVAAILGHFGKLDILVNNAGVNIRGPIEQLSEEDWDQVIDTNLKGPWLCTRAVMPIMRTQRWGRVVNISSMLGEVSIAGRTPYASSKGGLTLMTKTLALEGAPFGINVNALCPGPFVTEINEVLLQDPEVRGQWEAKIPLARWGEPNELGPAVVFLSSEAARYMTGATLFIDGGYTAQ